MATVNRVSIVSILPVILKQLATYTAKAPLDTSGTGTINIPADRIRLCTRNRIPEPTQAPNEIVVWSAPVSADQGIIQGAGRVDLRVSRTIEVLLRTRLSLDTYSSDQTFLLDPIFGHYVGEEMIVDALQNFFPKDASNNHLVTEPLTFLGATAASHDMAPDGWGASVLSFAFSYEIAVNQAVV